MLIVALFVAHWFVAVFFQSSFHHRYASHRMFTMPPRDRARLPPAHVAGAGLVVSLAPRLRDPPPRASRLQRHRARSARARRSSRTCSRMMWATAKRYTAHLDGRSTPEPRFLGNYPEWPIARPHRLVVDERASRWGAGYGPGLPLARDGVVAVPAPAGPLDDGSGARRDRQLVRAPLRLPQLHDRATRRGTPSRFDFLTLGELFQNNHHRAVGTAQLRLAQVRVRSRPTRCSACWPGCASSGSRRRGARRRRLTRARAASRGSISTPGLRTPAGSSARFAARERGGEERRAARGRTTGGDRARRRGGA